MRIRPVRFTFWQAPFRCFESLPVGVSILSAGLVMAFATVALPASSVTQPLDAKRFIALSEIRAGQRAVCRTVFEGRRVEEFDLEIVAVVPGGPADGAMILAKALGTRLEHDGIAAGMSGSPVFIDGR